MSTPRHRRSLALASALLACLLLPSGEQVGLLHAPRAHAQAATSTELSPVADATVRSIVPYGNDGATAILSVNSGSFAGHERALIRFDQAAMQAAVGANRLLSATVELEITGVAADWFGGRVGIHRMVMPWTEDGATWVCADDYYTGVIGDLFDNCLSSNEWGMSWYSWDPDPYDQTASDYAELYSTSADTMTFDVTADVESILAGADNDGWALVGTDDLLSGVWVQFGSKESSSPAKLILTYEPPPVPPGPDPETIAVTVHATGDTFVSELFPDWAREGSTRLKANSDEALFTKHALVAFDDAEIDAQLSAVGVEPADELLSARLVMTVKNRWSLLNVGHTIDVHRMVAPWQSDRATWHCGSDQNRANTWPDCATTAWDMLAPDPAERPYDPTPSDSLQAVTDYGGEMSFDVTDDVAQMLAGNVDNDGWLIQKPDQPWLGFISFFSTEGGIPPRLELVFNGPCGSGDSTCDGLDDDCDDVFDEDYVSTPTECSVGVCTATGALVCTAGTVEDTCVEPTISTDDDCDAIDDDCDGIDDEDYMPLATTCGVGACASTGITSCVDGGEQDSCTTGTPAADDATCDSIDDDCDGATDEDFVTTGIQCGTGLCVANGQRSCDAGQVVESCTPGDPLPTDASCTGVDEDCDGIVDEDTPPDPTGDVMCTGGLYPELATSPIHEDPGYWTGPPDDVYFGVSTSNVDFDFGTGRVMDGPGPDLIVYERDWSVDPEEFDLIQVLVSEDGETWHDITASAVDDDMSLPGDSAHENTFNSVTKKRSYDLAGSALSLVRYVRIDGLSAAPQGSLAQDFGFDLDAIGARYYWADQDGDLIADCNEPAFGTDPLDADSDDDQLSDGQEVLLTGTDPLDPDSDDDGVLDGADLTALCACAAPAAGDPCDGIDNDCDGQLDEDVVASCEPRQHVQCVGGVLVTEAIDDGDHCTVDSCSAGGGVTHAFDPGAPLTCEQLGYECGGLEDGCGMTLDCGSCPAGLVCGSGLPGRCDIDGPRVETRTVALSPTPSATEGEVTLRAQLFSIEDTLDPMSGLTLELVVGGETYYATTDGGGIATHSVPFPQPGSVEVRYQFAGTVTYAASWQVVDYLMRAGEPLPEPAGEPAPSHAGVRFVVAYGENAHSATNGYHKRLDLLLTAPNPTVATVRAPGVGFETTVAVDSNRATRVELPAELRAGDNIGLLAGDSGWVEAKGIEVAADAPVVVHSLDAHQHSSEGWLNFPVEKLGQDYLVATLHTEKEIQDFAAPQTGMLLLAATEDDTSITVVPSADLAPGPEIPNGAPRGVPVTFELDDLQILQLTSASTSFYVWEDLTGTTITASAPIAAYAGSTCSIFGGSSCDKLQEPLPPLSSLGTRFIASPPQWDTEGTAIRVTATADATDVWVNSIHVGTLDRGQVDQIRQAVDAPLEIVTSMPAIVSHYRIGSQPEPEPDADQSMLPPVSQYVSRLVVSTPEPIDYLDAQGNPQSYAYSHNGLIIVAETAHVGSVRVNGQPVSSAWRLAGAGDYSVARQETGLGQSYVVEQLHPGSTLTASVHGKGPSDSYHVLGAMALGHAACRPTATEPGDRVDNDCDGVEGEELDNGIDDDGDGLEDEDLAAVPIAGVNTAPVMHAGVEPFVRRGRATQFALSAHDAEGDPLTYQIHGVTGGGLASIDGNILTYTARDDLEFAGDIEIQVSASDGQLQSNIATLGFWVHTTFAPCDDPTTGTAVEEPFCNTAPRWPASGYTWGDTIAVGATEIVQWTTRAVAFDVDLDPLTFSFPNTPPTGMTVDPATGVIEWLVDSSQIGSHQVVLRVDDPNGGFVTSTATLTVVDEGTNVAPQITSLAPTTASTGELYSYAVVATDANGDPLTYQLLSGPAGMTISSSGVVSWTPGPGQRGTHSALVRVSDPNNASASQQWLITVDSGLLQFTSTPGLVATTDTEYSYEPTLTLLSGEPEDLRFALLDAPAGMSVDPTTGTVVWSPTGEQLGQHSVQLVAEDDAGNTQAQYWYIQVLESAVAPRIVSRPVTEVFAGAAYFYDVDAADYGQLEVLTYELVDGPLDMVIDPASGEITWLPDALGTYPVTVRVSDSLGLYAEQSYALVVAPDANPPEILTTVSAELIQVGEQVDIEVSAYDEVQVTSLTATVDGQPASIAPGGLLQVTGSAAGIIEVVFTAVDLAGNVATATVRIGVADPADGDPPVLALTSPAQDEALSYVHDIVGTVSDANLYDYALELRRIEGTDGAAADFTQIGSGQVAVSAGVLGQLDTTLLENGYYELRLSATDTAGQQSELITPFRVEGQAKVGPVQLSFVDMAIPMAGIPLTVVRNYDSRDKTRGDFGYGWSLDVKQGSLQHNRAPDENWFVTYPNTPAGPGFPCSVTQEHLYHFTEVRLSAREYYIFKPTLIPASPTPLTSGQCRMRYVYDLVDGSLGGAELYVVGNDEVLIQQNPPGGEEGGLAPDGLTLTDAYHPESPFDASRLQLELVDGRKFQLDVDNGVVYVEDRNQNSITIDDNGIHHAGGKSIFFQRDGQDRITALIAPDGGRVRYGYDLRGDLTRVTDQLGRVTAFSYWDEPAHHLRDIVGPDGQPVSAMSYQGGRLQEVCDAEGFCAHSDYDLQARSIVQTDATARPTRYEYDARGNVVLQEDGLGNQVTFQYDGDDNLIRAEGPDGSVAQYTYDGNGNMLTRLLPYEPGEDPADFLYSYTYNQFDQRETVTLPSGGVIDYDYDANGNQTAVMDGDGNVIQSTTYNADGTLATQTDRFGTVTFEQYNASGQPTHVRDIFGELIRLQYDARGNLVQRIERGVEMRFDYDALGRPTFSDWGGETDTIEPITCAGDQDCDTVPDAEDNCPAHANTDQANTDVVLPTDASHYYRFEGELTTQYPGDIPEVFVDAVGGVDLERGEDNTAVEGRFGQGVVASAAPMLAQGIDNDNAAFSFELWARLDDLPGAHIDMIRRNETAGVLRYGYGTIDFYMTDAGGTVRTVLSPAGALASNTWYHLVATFDGGTMRLYVDGTEVGSVAGTFDTSSGGYAYLGQSAILAIDEVVLYDRALSAAEVAQRAQTAIDDGQGDACDPCQGNADPTCAAAVCTDADGDGYGRLGESACGANLAFDCDDSDEHANPGATESCDGRDNDCDGTVDEGCDVDKRVTLSYFYGDSGDGRWTRLEGPTLGRVTRRFTAAGRLAGWVEPNGDEYTRIYDGAGRVSEEIDALGNSTVYGYDAAGRLERIVDVALGATTRFERDSAGRVTKTIDALGNETLAGYRAGGRLASATNGRGFTTAFERTPTSSSITDALTRTTVTSLTNYGLPTSTTYPGAGSPSTGSTYAGTTLLDGSQSFPTSFDDELGRQRQFAYDANSGLSSTTDLAGQAWSYTYGASKGGQVRYDVITGDVALGHHRGGASAYGAIAGGTEYAGVGAIGGGTGGSFVHHVDSVTSPMGETTRFDRGANGRVERVTYPDGGERLLSYGADGMLDTAVLPQGTTVSYGHDDALREVSRVSSLGESRTLTYGPHDRVETMTDGTGTTTHAYDPAGRFVGLQFPNGGEVSYERDALDRATAVEVTPSPGAAPLRSEYTYDENGNLATLIDPFGGITTFTHDAADRLVEKRLPNGVTTTYGYNDRDWVVSVEHRGPLGTVLQSVVYERSDSGEPSRITREDGSYVDLTYDSALRLDTETYYDAGGVVIDAIDYDYDLDGKRTSKNSLTGGFESYSYSPGFKLDGVTTPQGVGTYLHDAGGRLVSVQRGGTSRAIEYNSLDQITRVVDDGGEVAAYTYDGAGRRVASEIGGEVRRFLVAPNLGDGYDTPQAIVDGTGQLLEGYVFAGNQPLMRFDASGTAEYYLQDALGTVLGMSDAAGSLSATASYGAFGEVRAGDVSTAASAGGFGLHGMWLDDATGVYHVRARAYDPTIGRFLSRDPVAGIVSAPESHAPYAFVRNNPYLFVDPSGQFTLTETMVTLAVRAVMTVVAINALYSTYKFVRGFKQGWNIVTRGDPVEQVLTGIVALGDSGTLGLSAVIRDLLFEEDGINEESLAYTGVEVVGSLSALKGLAVGLSGTLRAMSRRIFDGVFDDGLTLGRDLFRRARTLLAKDRSLRPSTKADVAEEIWGKINEIDSSWSATRGPATNAEALFTGEGRPFGFAIDLQGRVWQIDNVASGTTFGQGGTITIDYSVWQLYE